MRLSHRLRFGLGLGLLVFAILCIPGTIINYTNIKQVWVLILGTSLFVLSVLAGLFLLIFVSDKEPIVVEHQEVKAKPQKVTKNKNKKPFISEKEWKELDEEDEEEMYIMEDDLNGNI